MILGLTRQQLEDGALLKEPARKGKRSAVILSGGNIDRELYLEALELS